MTFQPGDTLNGKQYIITRTLGEGGFGITYKVWDNNLKVWVVIKTPNDTLQNDLDYDYFLRRFQDECQRLAQFRNPHIVIVNNLFDEGNLPCLVMEFINGESLYDYVQRNGKLSEHQALFYIRQIATALQEVHNQGLVHRDATPMNIMLRDKQTAILIDFGIAGEISPKTITTTRRSGNPAFSPPEQWRGNNKLPTVDIYTLAASLYYAVTAKIPEFNQNNDLISPDQFNSNLSSNIINAITEAMRDKPSDRPQSMNDWLNLFPNINNLGNVPKINISPPENPPQPNNINSPRKQTPQNNVSNSPQKTPQNTQPTVVVPPPDPPRPSVFNKIITNTRFIIVSIVYIILGFALCTLPSEVWTLMAIGTGIGLISGLIIGGVCKILELQPVVAGVVKLVVAWVVAWVVAGNVAEAVAEAVARVVAWNVVSVVAGNVALAVAGNVEVVVAGNVAVSVAGAVGLVVASVVASGLAYLAAFIVVALFVALSVGRGVGLLGEDLKDTLSEGQIFAVQMGTIFGGMLLGGVIYQLFPVIKLTLPVLPK